MEVDLDNFCDDVDPGLNLHERDFMREFGSTNLIFRLNRTQLMHNVSTTSSHSQHNSLVKITNQD